MPNKPSLIRSRSPKPSTERETEVIEKGADPTIARAKKSKKTTDFAAPLNDYYRDKLTKLSERMSQDIGFKVSQRQLAAKAICEYIDRLSEQYQLD
ncbi:hypothetical protein [Zooshikella sp. RANM57]|uniref:hypothetical protein n=1 Tax=Zooshikella sp. RANM57 TaxID=3425863 RepID=UPI003D6FE44F